MRVSAISWRRYEAAIGSDLPPLGGSALPAPPTPHSARREWSSRAGVLLQLTTTSGLIGQGEATPLPGYSPDTLDDCVAALAKVTAAELAELFVGYSAEAALAVVQRLIPASLPAARFALETAALDLLAQAQAIPLWQLFRRTPRDSLPLSQLLPYTDATTVLRVAERYFAHGFRSFKVKVGRPEHWQRDIDVIASLRAYFGPTLSLRLDANQAFTAGTVLAQLEQLSRFDPEYVEEPCAPEILDACPALPCRIAFDESLQQRTRGDRLATYLGAHPDTTLVLKPMTLGGFSGCLALAASARAHGANVVVSHLFDGPVALAAAAHLALALDCRESAAGLAPHTGLSVWPDAQIPTLEPARIVPSTAPGLGLKPLRGV